MSEQSIEQDIQNKNLNAPRLTPALIDSKIKSCKYHVFDKTCLTVCCMTLINGFTVTGESACASPENFDADIGKAISLENARNKIWALEGYLLKQKLFESHDDTTFTGRLYIEHAELKSKIDKLQIFIISDACDKLPQIERDSLKEQYEHMSKYFKALSCRVSRTASNT